MKDNWIQPFQDKLGDYEFDLPAPAGRKIGWWVPLLAGAAAALLLMLLLRTPENRQQPLLQHAIADAGPAVQLALPDRPDAIRPGRSALFHAAPVQAAPAAPAATQAEAAPAATPASPVSPEEPAPVSPTPAETPTEATPGQMDLPSQWIPEEEEPTRRRHTLSTKLYAGNFTFKETAFQTSDSQEFMDMRYAKAEYAGIGSNEAGFANDYSPNHVLVEAVHAYSSNSTRVTETVCDLPLKAGLSLRYDLSERLSLESGLTYSYHHSKQSLSGNLNGNYYYDYRLHYVGIPLKLDYSFLQTSHVAAYLSLGGEAEMLAGGRIQPVDGLTRNAMAVKEHPLQFSLVGAAGAEYLFNRRVGLYAEPGVAYHFKPGGELPNYYREHPWSFDFRIGLRFRLN